MQIHFEFYVENLSEAKAQLRQLGATRPQLQAERDTGLLVMIDPAGHPFSSSPGSSAARPQQNQRSDPSLRLSRGL
jgi:hypothetical protein